VKIYTRLLLTLPFVLVVSFYYRYSNPDIKCFGLFDVVLKIVGYSLLFLTATIAFIGTVWKRKAGESTFDPASFAVLLFAVLAFIFHGFLNGHTRGDKWIYAESKASAIVGSQDLTLRKNGNFTININAADFGCSISGRFSQKEDTIFFDDKASGSLPSRMKASYLLKSNRLVPIGDTIGKLSLDIVSKQ
jgi:energy-coupling factor transporter transmembrane protein EcfT